MKHAVWLRNDLRLDDNPALYQACRHNCPVVAIYTITPEQWQIHGEARAKIGFRQDLLNNLVEPLAALGIPLEVISSPGFGTLPSDLVTLCSQLNVTQLWYNQEVPLNEINRDYAVSQTLWQQGIKCTPTLNDFLVPPEQLRTGQGGYYKVFTPWYRAWLKHLGQHSPMPLPIPEPLESGVFNLQSNNSMGTVACEFPDTEPYRDDLWPASENIARQRLRDFVEQRAIDYSERRDYPAVNGTSTLSPYLASGVLGVRRCLQLIQQEAAFNGQTWQDSVWLRELAWREFYRYLMLYFPKLSRLQPFRPETQFIQWEHDAGQIQAWQHGNTGYPIVDAAMRQLNRTGWMHNRLRMISASFYTKLMLHHWHGGEAYFMSRLLDGDFASNNGGWQWSASTGCDASPWFRVFNPIKQSEKFDPDGTFIRRFVPELAELDRRSIHNPSSSQRQVCGYPEPVIDYREARERVLGRFKALAELSKT